MWLSILNILTASAADTPAYPVWPNQFTVQFNETSTVPVLGSQETTGTFYYDWENKRSLTTRKDGHRDRYCALNGFKVFEHFECDQYVIEGDRYIDYPEKDECCYCCSAEHGCGMLFPTWMTNATYIGEEEHMGQKAYKWNKKGLQDNFYWETIEEDPLKRTVLGIYQETDDLTDYDYGSYELGVMDGGIVLPSRCSKENTCSLLSVCTALRVQVSIQN